MERTLIRFVTGYRHAPFGHRTGVLRAAHVLWESGRIGQAESDELNTLFDWMNENLAQPKRLTNSKHPRASRTAISWIRSSANEHVSRLRRVAQLVSAAGLHVEELRTDRPGYVVYEDEHQVVALPFTDTPT